MTIHGVKDTKGSVNINYCRMTFAHSCIWNFVRETVQKLEPNRYDHNTAARSCSESSKRIVLEEPVLQ